MHRSPFLDHVSKALPGLVCVLALVACTPGGARLEDDKLAGAASACQAVTAFSSAPAPVPHG